MDVYQIGISITMQNGVSAVIGLIQKQMLGLNAATQQAAAGFGKLKWAIAGATGAFIGVEILRGLGDLTKHGEKYTHQLEMMKTAGMQVAEMQSAINAANKVSSTVMSTTPAENLQTIRELRMALASADIRPGGKADPATATMEAVAHLETFQKITGIMSSVLSKEGKPFDGSAQAYELAKSAEMLGLSQDPKKFDTVLEGWTQAIIASGGKLQGSDIFGNVKYLRGAGLGMSMEFLTQILPSLAQEFKTGKGTGSGGGAGNPLASLFALIVGGQMASNKTTKAWESIGLLDPSKVHRDHGKISLDPGAVRGSDLAATNLYEFVKQFLVPALQKNTKVLEKNAAGEFVHPGELRGLLAALAPNRTAQQVLGMMMFQQNRITGDVGLETSAMKIGPAFNELGRSDPVLVMEEFDKQVERLQADIGKLFTPMKTEFFYQLASALRYLSETIEAHPTAAKAILIIIGGLAATLVVLGTVALAAAAISAIASGGVILAIVAGIAAFGAALIWLNEKFDIVGSITSVFRALGDIPGILIDVASSIGRGIKSLWTAIGDVGSGIVNFFATLVTNVKTAIWNIWTSLTDSLANLIQNLKTWFTSLPSRVWAAVTGGVFPSAAAAPAGSGAVAGDAAIPTMTITPPPPGGPDTKGTPENPLVVHVQNQTSGRDILNGAAGGMARQASRPSSGVPWTNPLAMPQLTPTPF